MEYYVIGERELVLAFMLSGVKGSFASNREEALRAFNEATGQTQGTAMPIAQDRPKVLILTEDVSDMLASEVREWQLGGKAPLIVEVPGLHGHLEGRKTLTDSIREAIGIQI